MKTAVFLGAGASKAFGYPLTGELLPRILKRLADGVLFSGANSVRRNAGDRAWFGEKLYAFLPGLEDSERAPAGGATDANAGLGIGITDLLTLVDRAVTHGEARATMSPEDVGRFRQLLERAIYEALMRDTERRTRPAKIVLDRFAAWLATLEEPSSVITTNYDTAVDSRIFSHVGRTDLRKRELRVASAVDFGFQWRRIRTGTLAARPARPVCRLFKLHGSVNWLRCSLCGQIYVNVRTSVGAKAFKETLDKWNTCHCNDWARLRLHLVTPSLIRSYQDPQLLGIWQAALETLRTADRWVIVGYSLPTEDVAMRSLFLRAWDGHVSARKPEIVVVQRENIATERIYRAFFPASRLTYHREGLEAFLPAVG